MATSSVNTKISHFWKNLSSLSTCKWLMRNHICCFLHHSTSWTCKFRIYFEKLYQSARISRESRNTFLKVISIIRWKNSTRVVIRSQVVNSLDQTVKRNFVINSCFWHSKRINVATLSFFSLLRTLRIRHSFAATPLPPHLWLLLKNFSNKKCVLKNRTHF